MSVHHRPLSAGPRHQSWLTWFRPEGHSSSCRMACLELSTVSKQETETLEPNLKHSADRLVTSHSATYVKSIGAVLSFFARNTAKKTIALASVEVFGITDSIVGGSCVSATILPDVSLSHLRRAVKHRQQKAGDEPVGVLPSGTVPP